jgi:hypothetical protein
MAYGRDDLSQADDPLRPGVEQRVSSSANEFDRCAYLRTLLRQVVAAPVCIRLIG